MHTRKKTLALGLMALCACGGDATSGMDMAPAAKGGTVLFVASGEVLALGGYPFPPASADDPAFVDGWEVKFDALLVTLDKITLSENPDKSPTDQSKTDEVVAQVNGPWAVDLHKGGPLMGKGGSDEQAVAIATIADQNLKGGAPFDATRRYAFGFDIVAASAAAKAINLDAQGTTDYADMVKNGWTVLYVGTATWKGSSCKTNNMAYDFTKLPKVVKFRLGFKAPTTYSNCQNPDNDPAKAFDAEEHQRGVQIKANATTIAQATVHTDHPFWETVTHDAPAHFDALAALASKNMAGDFVVTLEAAKGVNFTAFKDASGKALPWRSCLDSYTPPNTAMTMGFDTMGVPYQPNGDPAAALRDYYDYMTYNVSTQGHLNADGLCFVTRRYPSPQ